MSTFQRPILGMGLLPDGSGDVFFEPYSVKATNDRWPHLVAIFNDTGTELGLRGVFVVPQNYSSAAVIKLIWTATATSGNVVWAFDYRAVGGDDAESLDQTGEQETVNVTDAAPTSAHNRLVASLTLTDGNFAAGDLVEFEIVRAGGDASDDMAAAAILHGAVFEYSDS